MGIYEAVGKNCPTGDLRRDGKPDGGWLPKVGEKYPGSVLYWTELGLKTYLESGLQEWHRQVVGGEITALRAPQLKNIVYEDEYQVICSEGQEALKLSWCDFCSSSNYALADKVVAYIVREKNIEKQLLVFEHDKKWSSAGLQVPAGTVTNDEELETALLREVFEETGLNNCKVVKKIDEYIFFRTPHNKFNRRHVFQLITEVNLPDKWTHKVKSDDVDNGMSFHFYWLNFNEAERVLEDGFGLSIGHL